MSRKTSLASMMVPARSKKMTPTASVSRTRLRRRSDFHLARLSWDRSRSASTRGGLKADGEDAGDGAVGRVHGAVGEVEPGVGGSVVTGMAEELIFDSDALATKYALGDRTIGIGDFGKGFEYGPAERGWMACADERDVGVVVKQDELRTPLQRDGESAAEHEVNGGA